VREPGVITLFYIKTRAAPAGRNKRFPSRANTDAADFRVFAYFLFAVPASSCLDKNKANWQSSERS
jgi:hypothetical protein